MKSIRMVLLALIVVAAAALPMSVGLQKAEAAYTAVTCNVPAYTVKTCASYISIASGQKLWLQRQDFSGYYCTFTLRGQTYGSYYGSATLYPNTGDILLYQSDLDGTYYFYITAQCSSGSYAEFLGIAFEARYG